jgi:hypothetical protein
MAQRSGDELHKLGYRMRVFRQVIEFSFLLKIPAVSSVKTYYILCGGGGDISIFMGGAII